MAEDVYGKALLDQLRGLQSSYKLYQELIADADKRGDTDAKEKYEAALRGVREGIQKWVDSNFGS